MALVMSKCLMPQPEVPNYLTDSASALYVQDTATHQAVPLHTQVCAARLELVDHGVLTEDPAQSTKHGVLTEDPAQLKQEPFFAQHRPPGVPGILRVCAEPKGASRDPRCRVAQRRPLPRVSIMHVLNHAI